MRLLNPIAALLVAGTLAACGGGATTAPPAEIKVDGTEFAYTPSTLTVKAGAANVTIVNKGTLEHDFTIDSLSVKVLATVGKTVTAPVTGGLKAGTYDFYCSIPGHKEAGMTGTLTVQ